MRAARGGLGGQEGGWRWPQEAARAQETKNVLGHAAKCREMEENNASAPSAACGFAQTGRGSLKARGIRWGERRGWIGAREPKASVSSTSTHT